MFDGLTPRLTHIAVGSNVGSQLAASGLHAKIRLKNIPVYAPAQTKIVPQTAH